MPRTTSQIVTTYDPKPIPGRAFDWSATTTNFDASWEGSETGYVANEPVGYGATEQAAVQDLKEQLDEQELAPLVTVDDLELEDMRWQRGCDWMTDRDVQSFESGMRAKDFF